MRALSIPVLVSAAALGLTACGAGGDDAPTAAAPAGAAAPTVSVQTADGVGPVLVDAHGRALYAADQEADGSPRCVASCQAVWVPLTPGAGSPTAAGDTGMLGTVTRPDGTVQVTSNGRPLYTFGQDAPGAVTGDGVQDAFGGQRLTWHAMLAGGTPSARSGDASRPAYGGY